MSGRPKLTLSVIKIDPGGFVGHVSTHPDVVDAAKERLFSAKEKGRITDFHVLRCGNDIDLALKDEVSPSLLRPAGDDGYLYVVMPMRL